MFYIRRENMSEENKSTETNTTCETTQTEPTIETVKKPPVDSTVELEALKEMFTEQSKQVEALVKENKDLKVANAKLAITQSFTKTESPEEILNKMFK